MHKLDWIVVAHIVRAIQMESLWMNEMWKTVNNGKSHDDSRKLWKMLRKTKYSEQWPYIFPIYRSWMPGFNNYQSPLIKVILFSFENIITYWDKRSIKVDGGFLRLNCLRSSKCYGNKSKWCNPVNPCLKFIYASKTLRTQNWTQHNSTEMSFYFCK